MSDDWRALMSLSVSVPGGLGWMTTKHQASVGGNSSLPSGLAAARLHPGRVLTSTAVEVLRCMLSKVAAEKLRVIQVSFCG